MSQTLRKAERLCGRKRTGQLFAGGAHSVASYPLRAVWVTEDREGAPAQMMVTVPKRAFKKAVDRNRLKRLVREAYRLNKQGLYDELGDRKIALAFLYTGHQMAPWTTVQQRVAWLLGRIAQDVCAG